MLVLSLVVLVCAIPLLGRSADVFVTAASRLSLRHSVSPILVGALILGFGTSAPEALTSVLAAASGDTDVALGNIIGSNVANLTLVLGPAALLCTVAFTPPILRRELALTVAAALLLTGLLLDGDLDRFDAVALLAALVVAVAVMIRGAQADSEVLGEEAIEYLETGEDCGADGRRLWLQLAAGLTGTVTCAYLLVWSSTAIADRFGLSGGLVGVSLVAIGTSLPEIVTSLHAARRQEGELIVGNLLGSNIFNTLFVAGAAALVGPAEVDAALARSSTWLMLGVTLVVAVLAVARRRIPRVVAPFLAAAYLVILLTAA